MVFRVLLSFLLASAACLAAKVASRDPLYDYDVLQYIDPLIGSANGGNALWYMVRASH